MKFLAVASGQESATTVARMAASGAMSKNDEPYVFFCSRSWRIFVLVVMCDN